MSHDRRARARAAIGMGLAIGLAVTAIGGCQASPSTAIATPAPSLAATTTQTTTDTQTTTTTATPMATGSSQSQASAPSSPQSSSSPDRPSATPSVAPPSYFGPADPAWAPVEGSLTAALQDFAQSHRGTYSIVVMQPDSGRIIGAVNPDREFFTASIYKLHVAYDGYRAIDAGTYRGTDKYLGSFTRAQCLDAMIRSSYSPCAERWWTELGRERLDELAESRGFTHTDLVGLRSTARDSAGVLRLVYLGTGLSAAAQRAFLESMRDQPAKYRAGLPSGLPGHIVYDKVGWNLDKEWHDVAIVDFGAGRRVIVAAFTSGAGSGNLRALGRLIATRLAG